MSGIKSDRWIRRQCIPSKGQILEGDFQPMIEPYARNQVREIERNGTPAEFEYLTRHKCSSEEHAMTLLRELGVVPTSVRTDPLLGLQVREKIISYGTSSYGYDVRCADEFKVFTNVHSTVVDPKKFDNRNFVDFQGDHCIIPPNSFALARTVEYFRVPRDTLIICLGKSTYARCGIIVNVTPLEPEWEGHITLEFSNTTPLPAKVYANEGCAQFLFFQADADDVCETSYKDRGGKYQGQTGITLPRA